MSAASDRETDVVLIGAGIMSATLGVFLKELEPSLSIQMCEILGDCAQEAPTPGTMPVPATRRTAR